MYRFRLRPVETFLSPASGGWRRPTGGTASSESPTSPATASPSPPAAQAPPCSFAQMSKIVAFAGEMFSPEISPPY